jgi:hypothetical protein
MTDSNVEPVVLSDFEERKAFFENGPTKSDTELCPPEKPICLNIPRARLHPIGDEKLITETCIGEAYVPITELNKILSMKPPDEINKENEQQSCYAFDTAWLAVIGDINKRITLTQEELEPPKKEEKEKEEEENKEEEEKKEKKKTPDVKYRHELVNQDLDTPEPIDLETGLHPDEENKIKEEFVDIDFSTEFTADNVPKIDEKEDSEIDKMFKGIVNIGYKKWIKKEEVNDEEVNDENIETNKEEVNDEDTNREEKYKKNANKILNAFTQIINNEGFKNFSKFFKKFQELGIATDPEKLKKITEDFTKFKEKIKQNPKSSKQVIDKLEQIKKLFSLTTYITHDISQLDDAVIDNYIKPNIINAFDILDDKTLKGGRTYKKKQYKRNKKTQLKKKLYKRKYKKTKYIKKKYIKKKTKRYKGGGYFERLFNNFSRTFLGPNNFFQELMEYGLPLAICGAIIIICGLPFEAIEIEIHPETKNLDSAERNQKKLHEEWFNKDILPHVEKDSNLRFYYNFLDKLKDFMSYSLVDIQSNDNSHFDEYNKKLLKYINNPIFVKGDITFEKLLNTYGGEILLKLIILKDKINEYIYNKVNRDIHHHIIWPIWINDSNSHDYPYTDYFKFIAEQEETITDAQIRGQFDKNLKNIFMRMNIDYFIKSTNIDCDKVDNVVIQKFCDNVKKPMGNINEVTITKHFKEDEIEKLVGRQRHIIQFIKDKIFYLKGENSEVILKDFFENYSTYHKSKNAKENLDAIIWLIWSEYTNMPDEYDIFKVYKDKLFNYNLTRSDDLIKARFLRNLLNVAKRIQEKENKRKNAPVVYTLGTIVDTEHAN